MRARSLVSGLVALAILAGCAGDNYDLVLTEGDVSARNQVASVPVSTGVAIDRSALPTTPGVVVLDSTPTTTAPTTSSSAIAVTTTTTTPVDNTTGDNTGDSTSTTANSNGASTTTTVADGSTPPRPPTSTTDWLWSSLDEFEVSWENGLDTIDNSPFAVFSAASTTVSPMSVGGEGFANRTSIPGGVLGGTVESGGEISSLIMIIPDGVDPEYAMQTVWAILDGTPGAVGIFDGMDEYREFTDGGLPAEGTQRWIDPTGEGYSVVLGVVSGETIGSPENALEVTIVPVADESLALGYTQPLRVEILSLLV